MMKSNIYPNGIDTEAAELNYDICFIGENKGKESLSREISELCEKRSLKTAFYIGKEEDKIDKGICFLRGKISYKEVTEIVRHSRCLLELKVEPDCACCLRVQEAVIYNKKLLTNNKKVYSMPCCENSSGISFFNSPDEIDWDFIKESTRPNYHYCGELSVEKWLETIQNYL